MASKKAQYEGALNSIFSFIFANANKKGKGLKPPKPTGANATNDFAGALAEIASKPHFYANNAVMAAFDEAINKSLIEFSVDKMEGAELSPGLDDSAGRIRVRPRDFLKFVDDPGGTIDKAFKAAEQERKWAQWTGVGGTLDGAIGSLWAKRQGFNNQDALLIGDAARVQSTYGMEMMGGKMIGENAAISYLLNQGQVAQAQTVSNAIRGLGGKATKDKLTAVLAAAGVNNQHIQAIINEYELGRGATHKMYMGSGGLLSPSGYRQILSQNLNIRSRMAAQANNPQERDRLRKAFIAVETWNRLKLKPEDIDAENIFGDIDSAVVGIEERIAQGTATRYDNLVYNRLLGTRNEIDRIRKGEEFGKLSSFIGPYAKWDYNKVKRALQIRIEQDIINARLQIDELERQLNQNLITQQQFDDGKRLRLNQINDFNLQRKHLITLPGRDWRMLLGNMSNARRYMSTIREGEYFSSLFAGAGFVADFAGRPDAPGALGDVIFSARAANGNIFSKKTKIPLPRNDLNPAYARLIGAYYFTPMSLARTFLWNGELFAFNTWKNQQAVIKAFNTPGLVNAIRNSGIPAGQWNAFLKGNYLNKEGITADYEGFLTLISGGNFGGASQTAGRALGGYRRNLGLYNRFSYFERTWKRSRFYNAIFGGKGLNKRISFAVSKWLLKLSKDPDWRRAVRLFYKGGAGIRQLIATGIRTLLSSLGVTVGGPIGAIVVWLLTEFAIKVGMAIAKPVVKFLLIALIGLLFLIPALGTIFGVFGMDSLASQYRHIPPANAAQCVAYNPHAGLYPEPPAQTGTEYPPSGSTCPLNFQPQICKQGPTGDVSSYHLATKAIDVSTSSGTWTAPSDGEVVSFAPSNICAGTGQNYGGIVTYRDSEGNVYTIMHAKALVGTGRVSKGQAIAIVQTDLVSDGWCWTGSHYHLHVSAGGSYQNALDWYNGKLNCNVDCIFD